jgi:signal transduction histidine kinase
MGILTGLTLGKKIALLASASLLVGIGIFSFVAIRAVRQSVDNMLEDRLTLARLTADYIDGTLGNIVAEVSSAAAHLEGLPNVPGASVVQLDAIAERLSVKVVNTCEVSSDGTVAWSRTPLASGGRFESAIYPTVWETLNGGGATVSGLVPLPGSGTPLVLISAAGPADAAGNPVALVLAVDVAGSSIAGLVQPVRLGATGYVEILDQNGIVVARTQPGPEPVPFEVSDHSGRFASLIAAGAPTRGVCHSCHEPGFVVQRRDVLAFAPLSAARWGVGVRQSEKEAFAPIAELRQNLLLAGFAMLVIVAVFMMLTTRDVVGRIQSLTSASKRIARGDLVTAIAPIGQDELGVLAETLDEMRIKLRSSYEELEQRTNELSALLIVSEILSSVPSSADLESALDDALARILATTRADAVGVVLWDEAEGVFRYRAHRGLSYRFVSAAAFRPGEGIIGEVIRTGQTVSVSDVSTDNRAAHPDLVVAEGLKGFAAVPVRTKHSVLGVLNVATHAVHQFSANDLKMLDGIGGQIATALENVRLNQEIQRRDEMRRELLREVLAMQEEDRRRIARELHDETSQVIASLTANLEAIVGVLPEGSDRAAKLVRKTQALSVTILDEIQRLIYELRPSLLDDMGLVSAARWLAENNLEAGGVVVEFKTVGKARRLPSEIEVTLFRVIQEAMNNIIRHAGAKKARVGLYFRKMSIVVQVGDDGRGFDVEEAINTKDRPRGLGLLGMRERVELVNGTVNIKSAPGGVGTVVEVKIPIEEDHDG